LGCKAFWGVRYLVAFIFFCGGTDEAWSRRKDINRQEAEGSNSAIGWSYRIDELKPSSHRGTSASLVRLSKCTYNAILERASSVSVPRYESTCGE
jgi:hypothetical protein